MEYLWITSILISVSVLTVRAVCGSSACDFGGFYGLVAMQTIVTFSPVYFEIRGVLSGLVVGIDVIAVCGTSELD